jgi:hypothetical protein
MADYSHHHTYRAARPAHRGAGRRFAGVLAIAAILMAAALVWVWAQQRSVDSPLPRAPAVHAPATAASPSAKAAPAPMTPQAVAPRAAEWAPPSDAVAASGDTRPAR